jgi:hypothetical protein
VVFGGGGGWGGRIFGKEWEWGFDVEWGEYVYGRSDGECGDGVGGGGYGIWNRERDVGWGSGCEFGYDAADVVECVHVERCDDVWSGDDEHGSVDVEWGRDVGGSDGFDGVDSGDAARAAAWGVGGEWGVDEVGEWGVGVERGEHVRRRDDGECWERIGRE